MLSKFKELAEKALRTSSNKEIEELIVELNTFLDEQGFNAEILHLRANQYIKLQQHHKAINDYNLILSKNKSDKKAIVQLEMQTTILRYNNTDIYSSTNTNMDPWLE